MGEEGDAKSEEVGEEWEENKEKMGDKEEKEEKCEKKGKDAQAETITDANKSIIEEVREENEENEENEVGPEVGEKISGEQTEEKKEQKREEETEQESIVTIGMYRQEMEHVQKRWGREAMLSALSKLSGMLQIGELSEAAQIDEKYWIPARHEPRWLNVTQKLVDTDMVIIEGFLTRTPERDEIEFTGHLATFSPERPSKCRKDLY